MAKDSHLRNNLGAHSLSFDKVFLSIQLELFQSSVDGLLNFFAFKLYESLRRSTYMLRSRETHFNLSIRT